jgi:hypothetical protein
MTRFFWQTVLKQVIANLITVIIVLMVWFMFDENTFTHEKPQDIIESYYIQVDSTLLTQETKENIGWEKKPCGHYHSYYIPKSGEFQVIDIDTLINKPKGYYGFDSLGKGIKIH